MTTAILGLAIWAAGLGAGGAEHWEGTLSAGGSSIRLVVNLTRDDTGGLGATFDSPDQGSMGHPVDSVRLEGGELTFGLKTIGGAYRGTVNAAGTEAVGTWTQRGRATPLTLRKTNTPTSLAIPAELAGTWVGPIKVGAGIELRLVLRVEVHKDGARVVSFGSPDQGADVLPVDRFTFDGTKVTAGLKSLLAKFEGTVDAGRTEIVGTWTQAGRSFPLTLKKTDKVAEPKRTQVVRPPFPYRAEEVRYPNQAAGLSLAGTLTLPKGDGPFPAALLITGSGAQDRDETLLGHKPFLVIADALTRRGIAVLRVDDRGVGGSTGDPSNATTEDFVGDVEAGVAYLKGRKEVDPKAIGLIGHSEGGVIAPMVAARSADVAFLVLMAGTGVDGATIVRDQQRLILKAEGASEAVLKAQGALIDEILAVVTADEPNAKARKARLDALAAKAVAALSDDDRKALGEAAGSTIAAGISRLDSPWFRYFLRLDPKVALAKVQCPVLAINGENDLQVPWKVNLDAIASALKLGGNTRVQVRSFPGLNHLFQPSKTGSPSEYARIEQTIDPAVLALLGDWVLATTGRK